MGVRGPRTKTSSRVRRHYVCHWFFRSRLADCCAILSFDRLPSSDDLWWPAGLRRRGYRSSVVLSFDEHRPYDAGRLVRLRDRHKHSWFAPQHACEPSPVGCTAPAGMLNHCAAADDQQSSQRPLSHLGCLAQPGLAAGRLLPRCKTEPSGKMLDRLPFAHIGANFRKNVLSYNYVNAVHCREIDASGLIEHRAQIKVRMMRPLSAFLVG